MQKYERVFDLFDSDGDGKICPLELRACMASIGRSLTAQEAVVAVALMDSDGDGLLCLEDFIRILDGAGEVEKERDLKAAFQLYESDQGSGCITPQSLKNMLRRLGEQRSVNECRHMIAAFDVNGDGLLNFHEFKLMMS